MDNLKIKNIAIVDDHNLFRKGLLGLINGFPGFNVSLDAANGKDFITSLTPDNLPDLVLLDISMPVMNGFETAKYLQENFPGIKILALSMNNDEEVVLEMLKCGVDGYILKNADPSELLHALEMVQANGSYYSGSISKILKKGFTKKSLNPIDLSDREIEFLRLVCTELPYKSFAPILKISPRVVEATRDGLFKKLEVVSRVGLVMYAIKNGIYKEEVH